MPADSSAMAERTDRYLRSLRAVPVRNADIRATQGPAPGELTVVVRLRYGPFLGLLRRLLRARTSKTYVLDSVGREVFEDIDGTRDFETLIDRFAARHRLAFLEARALLAQYLQILARRGIVVATLPRSAVAEKPTV